jgi:hypothetical protein
MFLDTDPRRRLGVSGECRSILIHPFFKTVNLEAVLKKHVTPLVIPLTLEFLTVDSEELGNAEESRSDISFKIQNEGALLEGPAHKPETEMSNH